MVKDGFLAPYQDLAYFVRPLGNELEYIAQTSETFDQLVEDLCNPPLSDNGEPVRESMVGYTQRVLAERDLIIRKANTWDEFEESASSFAISGRILLEDRGAALPDGVPDLKLGLLDMIYWAIRCPGYFPFSHGTSVTAYGDRATRRTRYWPSTQSIACACWARRLPRLAPNSAPRRFRGSSLIRAPRLAP